MKNIKLYNSYYDGYNSTFGGEGESCVDIDLLKEQYLLGKTFSEIAEITGHTKKNNFNKITTGRV